MAKSPTIITGLDIGTSFIKIVVAQKKSQGPGLETLYAGQKISRGVRKGVVVDVELAARCVQEAVKDAELAVGRPLTGVYVAVGGSHIFCTTSRGLVSVSRADNCISEEDVSRVLQAARTISLSPNKDIVDVYPREFIVDGEGQVKDALGMKGVRLEAEVLIVAGFTPYLKATDQAVLRSGLEIYNRTPSIVAAASAVLSEQQRELGVAILDIGAGTSSLAVFEEGDLMHLAILPIGSANITNDIAIGLKTDVTTAERLKIEKGVCAFKGADKKIKLETGPDQAAAPVFSQKMLSKIISERVDEIFDLANKELKKIGRDGKLPAGIVLCGGGVKLPNIDDLAKKEFKLTVGIGIPCEFSNIDADPSLAVACGLVSGAWEERDDGGGQTSGPGVNIWDKLKKFFKIFIP